LNPVFLLLHRSVPFFPRFLAASRVYTFCAGSPPKYFLIQNRYPRPASGRGWEPLAWFGPYDSAVRPTPLAALLRFHFGVGARLALRALLPAVVAFAAAGILLGDDFLLAFAGMLFGPRSSGGSAVLIALAAFGAASAAAPRVCRGLNGWLRHLPVSGLAHRRAATLAVALAQAPLVIGLIPLSLAVSRDPVASLADALGLVLTSLAAALLVVPARRALAARPLAFAAAVAVGSGGWMALAAGAALLAAADAVAGPLAKSGSPLRPPRARGLGGRLLEARIAWRALGWNLLGAGVAGLLPLGAALAFISNNELAPGHARLAVVLGGATGVVLLFAQLGESLAVRRPAWPWSRSLPGSAARRVGFDALFLAFHTLPLLALAVWIVPSPALLAVAALVPPLALRAAGAMRRAPERRAGAAGEILAEGMLLAALTALLPWAALLALAATPLALRAAAERDRRQKVSRWLELHHLAAGDPQSWSAS